MTTRFAAPLLALAAGAQARAEAVANRVIFLEGLRMLLEMEE